MYESIYIIYITNIISNHNLLNCNNKNIKINQLLTEVYNNNFTNPILKYKITTPNIKCSYLNPLKYYLY